MRTQNRFQSPAILLAIFLVFLVTSCEGDKDENKPVVATYEITTIGSNEALCGGTITSDGGFGVSSRGVCWSTEPTPTIRDSKTEDGTGAGSFTSQMTDLQPNTNYYIRAYATNSAGTGYGNAMSFTTLEVVTDADGNVYKTIKIGNQTWMSENLKVTKYNDGTAIPNVTDGTEWRSLKTGAYCNYDNDQNNVATYGRLYNWYAVNTGKLAPKGWHVPTHAEWTELTDYLGGVSTFDGIIIAGGKLKERGTSHWKSPNTGATNEIGFTALPGGTRYYGEFYNIGDAGDWWCATEYDTNVAWLRGMNYNSSNVGNGVLVKEDGLSIRCLKD